jgi:hypothetical protein
VFVVAGDKAQQRAIRTGLSNGGWIEVVEGLQGGEQIVTVGQAGLKSGTQVKIVGDGAPKPAAAVAADGPKGAK